MLARPGGRAFGRGSARHRGGPSECPKEDANGHHTDESARSVALDRIDVPDNVRELDAAHVQALAGSIALQGLLVPLVVRPAGERFELVAGFTARRPPAAWA